MPVCKHGGSITPGSLDAQGIYGLGGERIPNRHLVFFLAAEATVYTVTLEKMSAGLGFSLEGGKGSLHGDKPLTINRIFKGVGCVWFFVGSPVGGMWPGPQKASGHFLGYVGFPQLHVLFIGMLVFLGLNSAFSTFSPLL